MNPYITAPNYETKNLTLRLICQEDAADLLACYSDPQAIARMNADNCIGDFHCATLEQMNCAIAAWLDEYKAQNFVRLSIIPKTYGKAVGTVEMFGADVPKLGAAGLLRIDLASEYEMPGVIAELTALAIGSFMPDFDVDTLLVKAAHLPERLAVFEDYSFVPTEAFRPGGGYYAWFKKEIAYCGLACCVCLKNKFCSGCQTGGCDANGWCKNYNCCREKGLNGCWECADFPCTGSMLDKPRLQGFCRYAKKYGTVELVRNLMRNKADGIFYHYAGQFVGDYDKYQTDEELFDMIENSKN